MKWLILVLLGVSGPASHAADSPAVIADLSAGGIPSVLVGEPPAGVEAFVSDGGAGLILSGATVQLRELIVKPAIKYTLTLEARFEGDAESIEDNSRFDIFNQPGHPNGRLPSHEIRFLDRKGKPVGQPLRYAQPFRNSHTYEDIFYSPHGAASVQIKLASGKGLRLIVSQLKLAETPDEGALNPNPTFGLGLSNYSGWKRIADGGDLIERNGRVVLDTKYGSTGEMIPLTEPGTYAFSAKATGNGYNSIVIIRVYDSEGKELMRTGSRKYGPRTYFVPPKEAVAASFLVYSCLLEEVRLIRVGDENAITELQKK